MAKEKKTADPQEIIGGKTRQEWNKDAQQLIRRMRKFYRKNDGNAKWLESHDLSEPFAERRVEALLNSLDFLYVIIC